MTALTDTLRGDRLLPAWFMYVDCEVPVRAWSGPGNFAMGANGPDLLGGGYVGLGRMVNVPSLRIPLNGNSAQHEFALSGVTADVVRLVEADRDNVRGAKTAVARLELDGDGNPVGSPQWLWFGNVDTPRMSRQGSQSPVTYTISLIATSGSATRKRSQLSFFTGRQQRERDADDAACDGVSFLQAGTTPIWPT